MIGVLVCGRFDGIPLQVAGGDYDSVYQKIFSAADPKVELRFYYVIDGDLPESPDECDGWVIGGSRTSANSGEPWLEGLVDFIRDAAAAGSRMVGLCFGHQVIAYALGGKVGRASAWTSSVQPLVLEQLPWFPGGAMPLQAMHEDIVTQLPDGGRVVGSGTTCDIPAYVINGQIFGIQYHPEIDAELAAALIDRLGEGLTPEERSESLESLETPTDQLKMADWILRFLRDDRSTAPTT